MNTCILLNANITHMVKITFAKSLLHSTVMLCDICREKWRGEAASPLARWLHSELPGKRGRVPFLIS